MHGINLDDSTSYQWAGDTSILSAIDNLTNIIHNFNPNENYESRIYIPAYKGMTYQLQIDDLILLLLWNEGIQLLVIFPIHFHVDPTWIVHSVLYQIRHYNPVTVEHILNVRYEELFFATLRIEYSLELNHDLFLTYPPTNFANSLRMKSVYSIDQTVANISYRNAVQTIKSIESLLKLIDLQSETIPELVLARLNKCIISLVQFESLQRELLFILTNLYIALIDVPFPSALRSIVFNFASTIRKLASDYKMDQINWIISVFSNWVFGLAEEYSVVNWTDTKIPHQLQLLPLLNQIIYNPDPMDLNLNDLVKLNLKLLSYSIPIYGMEDFQEQLGKFHLEFNNFGTAATYFEYAVKLHSVKGDSTRVQSISYSALYADSEYYREMASAANYFYYSGKKQEAYDIAWLAIKTSLRVIDKLLKLELANEELLEKLLEYFERCKRALMSKEDEMTQIIDHKLNDLQMFIVDLRQGKIDIETAAQMTKSHNESLQFLIPPRPTRFIMTTIGGKIIDAQEAIIIQHEINDSTSYRLTTRALSTVRSQLQEAILSNSTIEAKDLNDDYILIEARYDLLAIASVTAINERLKAFMREIASEVQERYGEQIKKWAGDGQTILEIKQLVRRKIEETWL